MKTLRNMFICLAAMLTFAACEEGDSEKDLGYPLIYIPQASITGLDNSYPVPNGSLTQNSKYVCKYDKETGTLDINVGVVRAGYIKDAKGFTVDLGVSDSETQSKVDEYVGKGTQAVALPLEVCTIPEKITVEAGKNSGSVYVSVNMKELSKRQASIYVDDTYKILVLGLEISNPTAYELAETNTTVVICLDLNSEEWDKAGSPVRTLFPLI